MDSADSITVDPHKGMFFAGGTGCVLVHDGRRLAAAHAADAGYLEHLGHDQTLLPTLSDYSLELTPPNSGGFVSGSPSSCTAGTPSPPPWSATSATPRGSMPPSAPTTSCATTTAISRRSRRGCSPCRSTATGRCGRCTSCPASRQARTGLIVKLHHAVLDGPSGAELMVQLLDLEPTLAVTTDSVLDPDRWWSWNRPRPISRRVARKRGARGEVWWSPACVRRPTSAQRRADGTCSIAAQVTRLPLTVPRTPFNQPVTGRRSVRWVDVSLDAIHQLAAGHRLDGERRCAGSYRWRVVGEQLLRHHALPLVPLVAMVPISQRSERTGDRRQPALGAVHDAGHRHRRPGDTAGRGHAA